MHRLLWIGGLLLTLGACIDPLEALPLEIGITASPAAPTTADSVTFVVTAQGDGLLGLEIVYGDGTTDQYPTSGARRASVSFKHLYGAPGTFQVSTTVTDAAARQKSASLQVTVQ